MEFGLNESKNNYDILPWNRPDTNNILRTEASSKFLKDVEEQYDTKLGFESNVQEKRENFLY